VTQPGHEARISRLEARMEEVAGDAAAARHLAAAHDRDLADLGVKVDAHRAAINALGAQTRERFDPLEGHFDRLEGRFDRLEQRVDGIETVMRAKFGEMGRGFAEMRHGFDQTAAGLARIAELITARDDDR
jgi:hypothetical protein